MNLPEIKRIFPVLWNVFRRNGGALGTPPKYKVYSFELVAMGLMDPMVRVFENTIGDIVWTRYNGGEYIGALTGAFTTNKCWGVTSTYVRGDWESAQAEFSSFQFNSENQVKLFHTSEHINYLTEPVSIVHGEIRVYY